MTNIPFSVIINCKNSEKYLKEAIDSVLDQSHENFEIIIVDNNSKDNTSKIIQSIVDPRIKYFKIDKDLSLGEARNFGILNSNGKYLAFLDSDDFWHKEKLKKSLDQFINNKIALTYSNVSYFNENSSFNLYTGLSSFSKNIFEDLLKNYNLCISSCVFNRIHINKMDYLFDPKLEVCEDLDFFLRLSNLGFANYVDEVLVYYRIHSNNLTKTKRLMFFKEKDYIFQKLAKNFSTKILKNLFFKNKLDEAKYFWKTDKNKESIRIILNSYAPNIFFKSFFSGLFLFKYSFILKIYSFFKSKKIDIEI